MPDKVSKVSKKRKGMDSEANDSRPVGGETVEESKRRKKGVVDAEETKQPLAINASVGSNELADKESEEKWEELCPEKSEKGKSNGSVQPEKPFQRVSVDEVVFIDKRLEDNSYWAKDGAENGYGEKAQEILGQGRGRDFRHEKTKKKHGTYIGGQIYLQFHFHSVKFNYSDDE